jgi:dipeptidyl-peptidase-4
MRFRRHLTLLALISLVAGPVRGQATRPDSTLLTLDRIFSGAEFRGGFFGPSRGLGDGSAYTTLERVTGGRGQEIVRYDTRTAAREVLVPAARLLPPGDTVPLAIEGYSWSADQNQVLIYTRGRPVWRQNTRGDYWVLDRATWRLHKLGGPAAQPSTLMFAKFSPDGRRVGYVREFNLYVEDLATGRIAQLTRDGSRTTINGTFDWVYEEELDLRDGWRWSPDGRWIAYWQLDASGVRDFALIDNTDSLYSFVNPVQYPKAGETNSAGRVGVVSALGGVTRWMAVPGDPRQNYIARMEWAPPVGAAASAGAGAAGAAPAAAAPSELVIEHLNRLQNTATVLFANARTGVVRTLFTERDSAWVDVVDDLTFVNGGRDLVWLSERSGWNHVYLVSRETGELRPLTSGQWDVLGFQGVDESGGHVYYTASPDDPTRRYLYRARLDGTGTPQRISPADARGSHRYDIAPNYRFAIHTFSTSDTPPVTDLVDLVAGHVVLRTLVDNAQLRARVAALRRSPREFFQVDIGDGVRLNAYVMKPPDFDATRRYPLFFTVYGGPGSQTVTDGWGGTGALWHTMLTQRGYVVMSVDNRGTGARGRAFKKIVYGQMGVIETRDQAAAARAIWRMYPWVDSTRVGIWGWSYGGFMALNTILQFPDVYRTAIAVAPVTHWKFYDTIYTERYNGLPRDNAAGYDRGSPLTYAANLRGNLLIVHGTGDDNVHYQNTETMVNALVAANRPFQLMTYPNRNHGISGGSTTRHLYELLTRFVMEKL